MSYFITSLIGVMAYFAVLLYVATIIVYIIKLVRQSYSDRALNKSSLGNLLLVVLFGNYGKYLVEGEFELSEGNVFGKDKRDKNIAIIVTLFSILGFSMIILPKIGQGTETIGSPFENDHYISYHYATLSELDEDLEPVSVEIFGIAEIDKNEDTRWINNIHIDNYGTFHAFSGEPLEVFEAPFLISDIDDKNYEVRVLESKPELRKTEDFYTKAVGVTFSDEDADRQEVLKLIKSGDKTITLVRDRENSHDDNAVRIYSRYGMVGFISKDLSPYIASELDYGGIVKATISEITGGEDGKNYGCNLLMQFYSVVEKDNYRPEPDSDERN